jgi:hypothetical protein
VTTGDPSMLINASGINGLFISGYYADRIQTGVFSSTTYPEITSYLVSDIYDTTFVLSWGSSSIDVEWNYSGDFGWVKFKYYGVDRNYGDDIWITTKCERIRPHRPVFVIGSCGRLQRGFQRLYAFVRFVVHRGDRYKQYIR